MESHAPTAPILEFLAMLVRPDNIPIVMMLVLVFWFTYIGLKEARKNDQLIREGRADEVLRRMQE